MSEFIKETDDKGRVYIIEGENNGNATFSIIRFICQVQEQQTKEETQLVADLILTALNNKK